jgi:hypothetical protein
MKRYLVALFLFGLSVSGFAHAQCAAFPCVVASVSLPNQSQAIPNTPIFTPTANGIFRINAYATASKGNNQSAQWVVYFGWTDDLGARKSTTTAYENSSNAPNTTFIVQDVAGLPLSYQTKPSGNVSGATYNLNIVVEQLQ